MGALPGLMGMGGGQGGTSFSPSGTQIDSPVTTQQATDAYNNVLTQQAQQQNFLTALQAQNGLGKQTDVYGSLGDIAAGRGPNPAQAMLANATAANTANQAALMAGQRGTSANAGLLARQAAMQGAANQQNAATNAAALQAQQSLNALNQQGSLANAMAAQQQGQTNQNAATAQQTQSNLLNSMAGVNQARVGMQSNINSVGGQLANTQMTGQQGMMGGLMNSAGSMLPMLAGVGGSGSVSAMMGGGGGAGGGMLAGGFGDAMGGAGAAGAGGDAALLGDAAMAVAAEGGKVKDLPMMAEGGMSDSPDLQASDLMQESADSMMNNQLRNDQLMQNAMSQGPQSFVGRALKPAPINPDQVRVPGQAQGPGSQMASGAGAQALNQGMSNLGGSIAGMMGGSSSPSSSAPYDASGGPVSFAKGGPVPALVSPGEQYLPPKDVKKVQKGANPLAVGERIPGKPKFPGNDYRNDVVPKTLESGGIVIPNEVMQSKNPHFEAMKFVHAHIAKSRKALPTKGKK